MNYEEYQSIKNKYDEQIEKDINRTLSFDIYFKNKDNLQKLYRLLHAIACCNPDVGYIQGMNFLAGYLLIRYDDEKKSFEIFNKMLSDYKYGLGGLYSNDFPRLYLAAFQVRKLCKKYIPKIYKHFVKFNIKETHWLSSYFLTLFLKNLEHIGLDNYNGIFNLFYEHGWNVLIKLTMIILKKNKKSILSKPCFSETLVFLLNDIWKVTDFSDIVNLLKTSNIRDDEIHELEIQYVINITKEKKKTKKETKKTINKKTRNKQIAIGASVTLSTILTITGALLFHRLKKYNRI